MEWFHGGIGPLYPANHESIQPGEHSVSAGSSPASIRIKSPLLSFPNKSFPFHAKTLSGCICSNENYASHTYLPRFQKLVLPHAGWRFALSPCSCRGLQGKALTLGQKSIFPMKKIVQAIF
ncbi:MAG: hypothetical protein KDD09_26720, partial [Phaeodactylibacter sp.]|nr:hypothetical protein [Phaeodactylibacter sp.]